MPGQRRSSVDAQFTQQNIGKFVNINKDKKAKGVEKGEAKTGMEIINNSITSASKLGLSTTIAPKKRLRPDTRSPEEVRRPPSKKHNKYNTMTAPTPTTVLKSDKKGKEPATDFAELERRLLSGFASMIQKEIEPLKQDIKEIKEDQKLGAPIGALNNYETIARKFNQTDEKHRKLQDRISFLEDQLLEKNVIFQGILETEIEDNKDIKTGIIKAIASTMTGETEEEQKKTASETSIDRVERIGKYNPMRTRPVKVKFNEKKDVDHLFKKQEKAT